MPLVDRAQKLWRQPPAIRRLPEILAKYDVKVDGGPFEELAKYVEDREEYMWRELEKCVVGKCGDCKLSTHVVRNTEVYSLDYTEENGTRTAKLLTDEE